MSKFYFTFGTGGQPYAGGWTEVIADNRQKAVRAFRAYHPDKIPGCLNCADVYSEKDFSAAGFLETGNFDAFCHETIILTVVKKNGSENNVH